MYDNEIKDKFVELRAAGKSFGDISQELGVVKSTLHRWADERADDIARLRRMQWEETEAHFCVRLEDQLEGLACDLLDYESHLSKYNLKAVSVREALMLVRETRRAYFQTRAILMGTAPRSRSTRKASSPAEGRTTCPNGVASSSVTSEVTRGPISPGAPGHTTAQPANAVQDSEMAPDPIATKSNETERFQQNGATGPRNTNDLQQSDSQSFDFPNPHTHSLIPTFDNESADHSQPTNHNSPVEHSAAPAQSQIQSPQSEIDDDRFFLGSVVINPHECNAAVVLKTLEQEAAHRARQTASAEP